MKHAQIDILREMIVDSFAGGGAFVLLPPDEDFLPGDDMEMPF